MQLILSIMQLIFIIIIIAVYIHYCNFRKFFLYWHWHLLSLTMTYSTNSFTHFCNYWGWPYQSLFLSVTIVASTFITFITLSAFHSIRKFIILTHITILHFDYVFTYKTFTRHYHISLSDCAYGHLQEVSYFKILLISRIIHYYRQISYILHRCWLISGTCHTSHQL